MADVSFKDSIAGPVNCRDRLFVANRFGPIPFEVDDVDSVLSFRRVCRRPTTEFQYFSSERLIPCIHRRLNRGVKLRRNRAINIEHDRALQATTRHAGCRYSSQSCTILVATTSERRPELRKPTQQQLRDSISSDYRFLASSESYGNVVSRSVPRVSAARTALFRADSI